jgi:adenylate kinase family enzyme
LKEVAFRNMDSNRKKISVIISGMPSVGKTTAANAISKKYHLKHVAGGDMLKQIALDRGYHLSGPEWWDTPEGMKFLS